MKFSHEFRTIANFTWIIIDIINQTVSYLENDGSTVKLIGILTNHKKILKDIYGSVLEISDRDINKQASETFRIIFLTSISGILDEYSNTVNGALHIIDLKHHDDIMYFLKITTIQSQTIKNEIDLNSV